MKVKSKQMNRCFTSVVIREMHIKAMTRCHCTPVRAEIQITDNMATTWSNRNVVAGGNTKRYRQTRWETVLWFPPRVDILLLHGTATALLDIYPEHLKIKFHTKTCCENFIAALFMFAKTQKQPRCPSVAEEIHESDTSNQMNISRC